MTEEANAKKLRRLIAAVVIHFSKTIPAENIFHHDGNPYHLEFCDKSGLTWKIRCVVDALTPRDEELAAKPDMNPALFRKCIAYRKEDDNKDFDLIQLK